MARPLMRAAILAVFLISTSFALADDPGYFLSWQQKKQLMGLGRIQDASGTWYDVWICPGYAPPGRYAKDHFFAAGRDFREYFEANKYQMLKKGSKACFDWALKECGLGFTVKGIPRAWGKHFSVAQERTQQRVFGWWLAYPWALMEASVETTFRGALGAAGTAGGVASGLAIVPAWHALDSAVAGTWNLGVNTIALPAVGLAWNTAVAPPLALAGQKPSESRVDGFWVTVVDSGQPPRTPPRQYTGLLAQWGVLLWLEMQSEAAKRQDVERNYSMQEQTHRQAIQAARDEADRQLERIQADENARFQQVLATNEWAASILDQEPELQYSDTDRENLRQYLREKNFPAEDIHRILALLRTYRSPRGAQAPVDPARPKTDPIQHGLKILYFTGNEVLREATE
ncbi:MAG: hypothetical protein AB7V14_11250 [Kiritimatiellia bacterium]